jgi:hypothetical protein
MKTKLFILLVLLTGCSNKERIGHYNLLGLNYGTLALNADFIYKDQQGVLEYGQVAMFDVEPTKYREATQDDRLKALELSSNMDLLKTFLNEAATNCTELSKLYREKNIFNSRKKQQEIDLYKKLINNDDSSILKVTHGVKLEVYFTPYLPKGLKESSKLFKVSNY